MNVFAKFDEIPSMFLQDIKETKRFGHTVGRSVGLSDNVKTVYPPTNTVCGGYNDVSTFSGLFLIGSFLYLQVLITYKRAWMSLKFGQIQPLVSMVTDTFMMGKTVFPLFLGFFFI